MDDTFSSTSVKRKRRSKVKESPAIEWQSTANAPSAERTVSKSLQLRQRLLAALMNKKQLPNIPKQSFSIKKAIGRKGGVIKFLGCRIRFPPKAFKAKTLVKITIRSIYDDAPQGYVVVSPEIEGSTSDVSFQRYATITLPVHAMTRDHSLTVVTKQNRDCDWEVMDADLNFEERLVTFQVHHFSIFKIFARFFPWLKMHLCHNLYYKASTSQLLGVTFRDDAAVKKTCKSLENDGFKAFSSLPDKFTLNQDEVMSYRYACANPEDSVVLPDDEVVLRRHDFESSFYVARGFMLEPSPREGTNVVSLRYFLSTPQRGKVENRIGLEWNHTATPQSPPQHNETNSNANFVGASKSSNAAGENIYTIIFNVYQDGFWFFLMIILLAGCLSYLSPYM